MRTKATLTPEARIISVLAQHREFQQYRMKEATGISYRTILRTLKPLEKQNLIKCVRTEPSEKGGKEKKIYALTPEGVFFALLQKAPWQDSKTLNKIINSHADKMLLFKKWRLFSQAGLDQFLTSQLAQALLDYKKVLRATWDLKPDTSNALNRIDRAVFLNALLLPSPYQAKFHEVCRQDEELRKNVEDLLAKETKTLQQRKEAVERFKEAWGM